jgi:hypothetical protein
MKIRAVLLASALSFFTVATNLHGQGTAFTYQGQLTDSGAPANGFYDLRAGLYAARRGGALIGQLDTNSGVAVSDGLFTIPLDFGGGIFDGTAYWLELGVRTNGGTTFVTLSPRQELTPAPYAVFAQGSSNVLGVVPGGGLSGAYSGAVTFNNVSDSFSGAFTGNGGGLTNVNAATLGGMAAANFWQLGGNNLAAGQFLGTANNQPLELWANGARALRLEPNSSGAPNVIGGSANNLVEAGVVGVFIGGGNHNSIEYDSQFGSSSPGSAIGGGYNNLVEPGSPASTIAGGSNNAIFYSSLFGIGSPGGAIGGGYDNDISFYSAFSTIGGGISNSIFGAAATVGGGNGNSATSSATVGGGFSNNASSQYATVGGGYQNIASGAGAFVGGGGYDGVNYSPGNLASGGGAVVAGGLYNIASGSESSVGGGYNNTASGFDSTVPGGALNVAGGSYSFAAGDAAQALDNYAFVWADGEGPYSSDRANQFKVQAAGGVVMDVSGSSGLHPAALLINSTSGNGVGLYATQASSDATAVFANAGTGDIVKGFSNGNLVFEVVNNGAVNATAFNTISDRNAKEHFAPIRPAEMLDKIASLPISEWNYKTDAGTRHVGPMAQDFQAAFQLGADDKHISMVDEGGVALAAIQGLNQKLDERGQSLERQLREKETEIQQLQRSVAELKQQVLQLTQTQSK